MNTKIIRTIVVVALSALSFSAFTINLPLPQQQLMLAFRLDATDVPVEPEDAITRINGPSSPERTALMNRLGNPIAARSLIGMRLPSVQPTIVRRVHLTNTYLIFPENELSYWESQGFSAIHHIGVIGYAYGI